MRENEIRKQILNNVADVKEGAPIGNRNAAKDYAGGGGNENAKTKSVKPVKLAAGDSFKSPFHDGAIKQIESIRKFPGDRMGITSTVYYLKVKGDNREYQLHHAERVNKLVK